MKRLITTLFFVSTVSVLHAQIKKDKTIFLGCVVSDSNTLKDKDYGYIWTDFHSILESRNKIEIRFITYPTFLQGSYTILTFNKKWEGKHFYHKPGSDSLVSRDVNKKLSLDTVFSKLVNNNIFSLPGQDSMRIEKYSYNPDTDEIFSEITDVSDGACYVIEFKIGYLSRRYTYCNPNIYADFYSSVHELRDCANIVDIFEELEKE